MVNHPNRSRRVKIDAAVVAVVREARTLVNHPWPLTGKTGPLKDALTAYDKAGGQLLERSDFAMLAELPVNRATARAKRNQVFVDWATQSLAEYDRASGGGMIDESTFTLLLASLHHLADARGWSWPQKLREAAAVYKEEIHDG